MKRRGFIASILASLVALPGRIFSAKWEPLPYYGKRVYPIQPDDLPGLIAVDPRCSSPVYIIREFDDLRETLNGQWLSNARRNKFWGYWITNPTGEQFLCCFDWYWKEEFQRVEFYKPTCEFLTTTRR